MENKATYYQNILLRVIDGGSMVGSCAKLYLSDEKKGKQFIVELFEMSKSQSFGDFLGEQLVIDIKQFVLNTS